MHVSTPAVLPRRWLAASVLAALLLAPALAAAQSKEVCLDAHGKGQDLRDAGKLSEAREQFLKCAQSACPSLVQSDCARFGEELSRIVPSVTFVARDAKGNDLTEVTVFVDDAQVTRLLAGKSYDVDPGSRTVRFVYGDKTVEQKVVISQGEKGRTIAATFEDPAAVAPPPADVTTSATPDTLTPDDTSQGSRSLLPLGLSAAGLLIAGAGAVYIGVGLSDVPDNCSYGDKECTGVPNDPVFGEAKSAAEKVNVGIVLASVGAGVTGAGIIWYFAQTPSGGSSATTGARRETPIAKRVTPWFSRSGGGFNYKAAF